MAKHQGLTLNPTKVSGMCGRLMCCLVYEQQIYRRMRKSLPRAGQRVRTELGEGEILGLDVINRKVTVRLDENGRTVNGAAADTDTMVASVRAYINALNKLLVKRGKRAPDALSA